MSDYEWVRQIKEGDEAALNKLWEMLYRDTEKIARPIADERNENVTLILEVAYNVAVESYEQIVTKAIHQYKHQCAFRTYCWTIMKRALWRKLRQRGKLSELPLPDDDTSLGEDQSMKITASPAEIEQRLASCWQRLLPLQQHILNGRYWQEKRPSDLAQELSVSRANINMIALRARKSLKRCLQAYGFASADDVLYI